MRSHISTAAFIRLIFLKDVRALRYPLVFLLMLALAVIFSSEGLHSGLESTGLTRSVFVFLLLTGAFLLTVQLILADPTGREFRFLLTRPVPGSAIGLAKALFIIVFLMVPYWLGLEFIIACSRVPVGPIDHLLLLIETMVHLGSVAAVVMLLNIFLRNGIVVFMTAVVFICASGYLMEWLRVRSYHTGVLPHFPSFKDERLFQFRLFLSEALFLALALLAIGWRYHTRDYKTPFVLALSGVVLGVLANFFFPYDLSQGLQDRASNRSLLTSEQLGRIKMTLIRENGPYTPYSLSGGDWNGIYSVNLSQTVRLEGLEPCCFVQTVGYHAVITLRSGKTFTSDYADFNAHGGVGGLYTINLGVAQGLTSWPKQQQLMLDLMSYLPRSLPDEDITGATVKGVITLEVRRAYVAGVIPTRSHAFLDAPRRRYEIDSADYSNDAVTFRMNILRVPLILRGDLAKWNTPDDLQWLLFYKPLGQALQPRGTGSQGSSGIGVQVNPQTGTYIWPMKGTVSDWRPCPPDWASGAELVFIGSDPCGQVTLPYEIDNVDLDYRF